MNEKILHFLRHFLNDLFDSQKTGMTLSPKYCPKIFLLNERKKYLFCFVICRVCCVSVSPSLKKQLSNRFMGNKCVDNKKMSKYYLQSSERVIRVVLFFSTFFADPLTHESCPLVLYYLLVRVRDHNIF